ncbi:unnamed protein product [Paramecium octaurelia]|uniref:[histone H3]-lysine(4) N-trimethyltransferase n=1 Tax=Paramecium octaurelia TaxID=43137 RepID=A0A8S1UVP9_PAROT|nr:unnamed protein product [Paramecium octaurelia]
MSEQLNISNGEYFKLLEKGVKITRGAVQKQQTYTDNQNISQSFNEQSSGEQGLSSSHHQSGMIQQSSHNEQQKKTQKQKKSQQKKLPNSCQSCASQVVENTLCNECLIKYEKNKYCILCKKSMVERDKAENICECRDCGLYVHKKCEPLFKDRKPNFDSYRCPKCRIELRKIIFSELIRYLTYFDDEKLLWQYDPSSVKYREVIKNPIDFDTIHKKNKKGEYLDNPELKLYADIKLMCSNFLEFNLSNPKAHRKGSILKILYDILFQQFRGYLKLTDEDLLTYKNNIHLFTSENVQLAFRQFLNYGFGGKDLVNLEGINNYIPLWEPQLLSITQPVSPRNAKSSLIQWEKTINLNLDFENEDEPLIKLNMIDFLKQQVQREIKIKIDINKITQRHPYLDYLFKLEPPQLTDDSIDSPQLQYIVKDLLIKDLSTVNLVQPFTMKVGCPELIFEYICCSCGGYEFLDNLLMCENCHKTYHFYCQINNSQYHQQRVIKSLQNWTCNNCVRCKECDKYGQKNDLFCCNCNEFYHFQCVFNNFIAPSDGLDYWKCKNCFKCAKCQTTKLFGPELLSRIKPTTTSNTVHISIEYFQNFQYCLSCGLDVAGFRFCQFCEEYIQINNDQQSNDCIEIENSKLGSLYRLYFQDVKQSNVDKIYLNKETKAIKQYKQCVKCKQFYHVTCLLKNKKTINNEGICSDCSQDISQLLFKIEKLKEQSIRQTIKAKSLKKVVPVVSNFLEWAPQLNQVQQTFIMENLEQLESLVSNFFQYQQNIENLKEDLTNNKDISDEYIGKLTQYWCARYNWFEAPKQLFTVTQQKRQEFVHFQLENDFHERQLLIHFFKQKKQFVIFSLQTIIGQSNTLFEFSKVNRFALDTINLITDLQCCFVQHLKYENSFQYLDNQYYTNYLNILDQYQNSKLFRMKFLQNQKQQLLFLPIPNSIVRSIKKQYTSQMVELKKQQAKDHILVQKGWLKIATNYLKQNIKQLNDKYSETQITEKLKSYQQNNQLIKQCIQEMKQLHDNKIQEAEQILIKQEQEMKQQPREQCVIQNEYIQRFPQQNEDQLIESPLDKMQCQLCKKFGNRSVSGRLLYVDDVRWVHTNCVLWNEDSKECELTVKALLKNNNFKCEYCQQVGSSIICGKCRKRCHFYCGYKEQWAFTHSKKVYCQSCFDNQEQCVTSFMIWRKIVVQQKQDKKSQTVLHRYSNTILIALKPSEQRGQFEELNLLTLRDKILYISLNMKEFKIRYAEVSKQQFLRECEKSDKNRQLQFSVTKLVLDKYPYKEYKVQNLQELVDSSKDNNIKGIEFAENLGEFFLLYTQQVRQQLLDTKNIQKMCNSVCQFSQFKEWFYQQSFVEDLPLDERMQILQQISRVITETQVNLNTLYDNHPMLYDNLPTIKHQNSKLSRKDPQQKIVTINPNDILEETNLLTEELKQIDKQEELEKKLKQESKNQKQKNKLYVAPSHIHKYGLFTKQDFKKGDFVIEYTGEVIRNALADYRELTYNEQGFGDCYMFRASKTKVIDATFKGSEARFLNHSCQPNCDSLLLDEKILIYARKDILVGEELTYDYQFEIEAESQKIQCSCGAKNCIGRLN